MTCTRGCCATNREHWLSVGLAPSATPTRTGGARAAEVNATEKQWSADMDAYKRLRRDGEQPDKIDGAAHLEARADSRIELQSGQVMTKQQRATYRAVTDDAA